ncbi:MAG: hypothetical protein B6241_10725 [Spirochaetaceae bacterium 4572_59]|nr:MAG: hypothetical protein B6241_10725 [Spirochaetaceae bacterium 4572_59]
MASMKDVARLAGVSVSTVSRVISGAMRVEEPTKKKVEEAIRKVNYKPNLLAQGLRIKNGKMIGLIVPEINHPSFVNIINYTEKYAAEKSLNLVLCNTYNDPEKSANAFDQLLRRNINGIILSRVSDESQVKNLISNTNTPVIIIDRALDHEDVPNIILNNYKAGQLAAEHLIKSGRKRIACITGSQKIRLVRERLNGFRDILQKHGIALEHKNIFEGDFSFKTGEQAARFFLELNSEIDSVWAQSDLIAAGLITAFQRAGKNIPEDISVIGMDNITQSTMMYPTITTIIQPYEDMCRKAIEVIDTLTEDEKLEKTNFIFEPELIVRESAP